MADPELNRHLIFVSGLSGAGKSVALHTLEDLNYYCIDNLPIRLMDNLMEEIDLLPEFIAIGLDPRNIRHDYTSLQQCMDNLRNKGIHTELIFLEAGDEVLTKRFSETRRKHPLSTDKLPLSEAIKSERQILGELSETADLRIDTSHTTVHALRRLIRERVTDRDKSLLSIQFLSFGYKFGLPRDADFVFDVRCLPNPYWDSTLRPYSGRDWQVMEYLDNQERVRDMQSQLCEFLEDWVPEFETENRSYLTVAVGCTGGRHRSVYMVDRLAEHMRSFNRQVIVRHRDL